MTRPNALTCRSLITAMLLGLSAAACSTSAQTPGAPATGEWRAYASTIASNKYSALDQINKNNVRNLRVAWRQSVTPMEIRRGLRAVTVPFNFEGTPLMVGGLLYTTTGINTAVALDPTTGKVVWADIPPEMASAPPLPPGEQPEIQDGRSGGRGLSYWSNGDDARVIYTRGQEIIALNAKTGQRIRSFGVNGTVDLKQGYAFPVQSATYGNPPLIVRDVIVVGGTASAPGRLVPGNIRGFDVRSGKLLWSFNVIPRPGEVGNESWLNDSWSYSGAGGTWSLMSGDEELGYVYVPHEQSSAQQTSGDHYGGRRPGNNLFEGSIVALDAKTGRRVWHFQTIHHALWDWDLPAAPNLVDITVDGRRIKALAQVSKISFVYVLDRATGQPVWPIVERPVPAGNVPGEWYSPTQPYPTKPPGYDHQELTTDSLIDFTPELRQEAIKIVAPYRMGSLFMPPTVAEPNGTKGSIVVGSGATAYNGAGFDPETGTLFVTSAHAPKVFEMVKAPEPNPQNLWVMNGTANMGPGVFLPGPQGLPDPFKPPYGRLVAIDLNKGEIKWTVANGEGPRNHPALRGLNLPRLGQPGRAATMVTKTMVFLGEGGYEGVGGVPPTAGGKWFRAYDKETGAVLWEMELPGGTTSAPMTYMANGKQYIVVAVGWKGVPGELVALALP
jgi:quinoprotein glucose dehydrogenase